MDLKEFLDGEKDTMTKKSQAEDKKSSKYKKKLKLNNKLIK